MGKWIPRPSATHFLWHSLWMISSISTHYCYYTIQATKYHARWWIIDRHWLRKKVWRDLTTSATKSFYSFFETRPILNPPKFDFQSINNFWPMLFSVPFHGQRSLINFHFKPQCIHSSWYMRRTFIFDDDDETKQH